MLYEVITGEVQARHGLGRGPLGEVLLGPEQQLVGLLGREVELLLGGAIHLDFGRQGDRGPGDLRSYNFV